MINCKNNTVMSGYPAAARTRAAKSGRQACVVKLLTLGKEKRTFTPRRLGHDNRRSL